MHVSKSKFVQHEFDRSGKEGKGAEEPVSSEDVLTTRQRISKLLEESGDEEELMWKDTSFNM